MPLSRNASGRIGSQGSALLVRQTASVIFLELLGGLFLLFILACGLLALRLSAGPIELTSFRDDVEAALSSARGGREVSIEALQLEWSAERRRVEIRGETVRLFDGSGRPAAEAKSAQISVAGPGIFFGRAEVLGIQLKDGWIALDQTGPEQWSLAGSPLPSTLPRTPPGSAQAGSTRRTGYSRNSLPASMPLRGRTAWSG